MIKEFRNKLTKKLRNKESNPMFIPNFDPHKDHLEDNIDPFDEDEKDREAYERLKRYINKLAAEQEKGS
ncbi:MAG: hypothetical protein ACFE94_19475 [Candidatus Hodarchaeota archaeon]